MAKEKGMSKEEIEKKLNGLESKNEKLVYAQKLLENKNLFDDETLGFIYMEAAKARYDIYVPSRLSATIDNKGYLDRMDMQTKVAQYTHMAGMHYQKAGLMDKAKTAYKQTGRRFEKPSWDKDSPKYDEDLSKEFLKKAEEIETKGNSLEKKLLGVAALGGFIFSLFFISSNITGNAIGNLDGASNNIAGILILVASFLIGFMALKK